MKTDNVRVNGETLSYLDSETGDTTLLFLHGAFINKEYWSEQLAYFSRKYRAVAVDLAGHGCSSHHRTEWTAQQYGKDMGEFIKKLSLKDVILIGHSAGADVMLETEAYDSSQIKGIVEIDHLKNVGMELPREVVDGLIGNLKTNFASTCEQYARQALLTKQTDARLTAKLLSDYRQMNPEVGIPLLRNGFSYAGRETELLKGLTLKLYLLHVGYTATNEENLKQYLGDNYELHTMNGTCHYPMLENPHDFNESLERILSKIKEDQG